MVTIDLSNQDIFTDNASLFQWDYGQSLVISGLSVTGDVQVHFARKNTDAEIRMGVYADSKITVAIPDIILQKSGVFHAYIYLTDGTSGETVKVLNMNVREREKPTDYTSEPYVDVVNQLNTKLNQIIATGIADYEPDPAIVEALVTQQVNTMLANLGNMATKDQVAKSDLTLALSTELDGKINSSKITTTLAPTQTGFIHDAKTVGDAITEINNKIPQSTAVILTTANGWSGTLEVSKNGLGQVWFRGSITVGTIAINTAIASIPIGYRPSHYTPIIAFDSTNSAIFTNIFALSNVSGNVIIGANTSGLVAGHTIVFNILYQI